MSKATNNGQAPVATPPSVEKMDGELLDIPGNEEVQKTIDAQLAETKAAQNVSEVEALPKGNSLEEKILSKIASPEADQPKKQRGRPPGSQDKKKRTFKKKIVVKEKTPTGGTSESITEIENPDHEPEAVDMFTPMVNMAIAPIVARIAKKDYDDVKITDAQSKEAIKYMPKDVDLLKPSWPAFFVMLTAAMATNAMHAPKKNAEVEQLNNLKKELEKSMEVESLRRTVMEMKNTMDGLMANRNNIPDGNTGTPFEIVGPIHSVS